MLSEPFLTSNIDLILSTNSNETRCVCVFFFFFFCSEFLFYYV